MSAIATMETRIDASPSLAVERTLVAMLLLAWTWCLLPLAIVITLRLPPFAFGHEAVGVRFFQAWEPLYGTGEYPFVLVGFLLDLVHRGLLFGLIRTGYAPERDLIQTMTLFADISLLMHAVFLALISGVVVRNRALPATWRVLLLVTGASLGYVFYWGPLRLFIPDYPLTLTVVAYGFLVFAATTVSVSRSGHDATPQRPSRAWRCVALIAMLATAVLSVKPSLAPYAVLIFVLGARGIAGRLCWVGLATAAGATVIALTALWLLLHSFDLYTAMYAAVELVRGLASVRGVELSFQMREFVTPGSIYFAPFLGFVVWIIVAGMAFIAPEDRRLRVVPGVILAGGLFYLIVLAKRPGNATTFEILVYLAVTGTLCVMLQRPSVRPRMVLLWCALLLAQTSAVSRSVLPSTISGARYTAEVARDVDRYARSFALPIVYVYPDASSPAVNDVFQSAESAVFKGTIYCTFVEALCDRPDQDRVFSLMLPPYRMVAISDPLPTGRYVLLLADVPEAPSVLQQSASLSAAFSRARSCRQWTQWRHTVRVCVVPAPGET